MIERGLFVCLTGVWKKNYPTASIDGASVLPDKFRLTKFNSGNIITISE